MRTIASTIPSILIYYEYYFGITILSIFIRLEPEALKPQNLNPNP